MAVIRVNKTADYTVMSNSHFKERGMTLKAKGLLSLMLSLPDSWDYSIAGLCAICVEKESAVKSTLDELRKFGYLRITKKYPNETDSGRIEYIYDIFETPQNQVVEEQEEEKQGIENQGVVCQGVENQGQLNTKQSNTKRSKTNELNTNDISAEFEILWKLYPRKLGKPKALKAYEKARKNGVTFERVKQGIENYRAYIEQEIKQKANKLKISVKKAREEVILYVKHGSTWFNGECWNDEYEIGVADNGDNGNSAKAEQSYRGGTWL